jgi:hypothetical protein
MAAAYMEQYGEYVGNFLLGAVSQAMEDRDQAKAADWLAICDCVDELSGGRTIVHPSPPREKDFSH